MQGDGDPVTQRLELAIRAAREAGDLTLRYFRQSDVVVETKHDRSPVTIADRSAEMLLRERISQSFPEDGILGEEHGVVEGSSGFRWILDPIDGTKSFICGVPLYGTLIGIEREGQSAAGVILIPALGECAWGAIGHGAWYHNLAPGSPDSQPRQTSVSARTSLSEAVFLTSQIDSFDKFNRTDAFLNLQAAARITRTWGDCYGYLLVATGRADVMVDPMMHVWDSAALLPIIEEAGGRFTDWKGASTIHSGNAVATNGRLHDDVLAITSK